MVERNGESAGSAIFMTAMVAALAFNVGSAVAHAVDNVDGKVHDVQVYNGQVHDQLARSHQVGRLILTNGKEHTFSFHTQETGADQTCSGTYEVQNGVAHVVGNLSCVQVVNPAS